MPTPAVTNPTTFNAANVNATKSEVVKTVYLDAAGGSTDISVPSSIGALNRIVFDMPSVPLKPTTFVMRNALNVELLRFTVTQRSRNEIHALDNTGGLKGNDKLTLEWPAFEPTSGTWMPQGGKPAGQLFVQYYESPEVLSAEQLALQQLPTTPRKRRVTDGMR